MIEINLIPTVKLELLKARRIRSVVISASMFIGIVAIGIVIALSVWIFAVQAGRNVWSDTRITDESKKLSKHEDLSKVLTIQNQLSKISALNDSKKMDSRLFAVLVAVIPPAPNDIKLYDISIDAPTSTITINGQAKNSYAALEIFKKTLIGAKFKYSNRDDKSEQEVDLASDISTSDTSYGEDSTSGEKVLRFKLSFKYDEAVFSPLSKNISIKIGNKGNVTDSYLGLPKSLFVDEANDLKEGR